MKMAPPSPFNTAEKKRFTLLLRPFHLAPVNTSLNSSPRERGYRSRVSGHRFPYKTARGQILSAAPSPSIPLLGFL